MPILKILGVILIFGAGVAAAESYILFEKKKIAVLDGWTDLIRYIRLQIDCFLMPLPEILAGADRALLSACNCERREKSLCGVYRSSQRYLDRDSRRLLCSFLREIGSGYREEQLRRCDHYIASISSVRARRAEEFPARRRITVAICLCSAAFAAILLW